MYALTKTGPQSLEITERLNGKAIETDKTAFPRTARRRPRLFPSRRHSLFQLFEISHANLLVSDSKGLATGSTPPHGPRLCPKGVRGA
jgi:hypothetical protein